MKDKTIISIEIDKELKEKLTNEADNKEMSVSAFIRLLIKNYFKLKKN